MARGLRPGLMLSRDVMQPGTWLPILKAGTTLTPELIAKIRKLGLEHVALGCLERPRPREPMGFPPFLLQTEVDRIIGVLVGRGDQSDLRQVVYDAARRLAQPRSPVDFRIPGQYELFHPVNVFALSLVVGQALGYGPAQLVSLGTGALLHDIGKAMLPPRLVSKLGGLTAQELELMRHHPALGVALLARAPRFGRWLISREAIEIVRHHHERFDGTGYPDGLAGPAIPRMASIVAVADVYDAMTSDRLHARRTVPGVAHQTIRSLAGRHFDPMVVEAFLRRVLPYPAGSEVVLSDRRVARVARAAAETPLRPVVTVEGEELDLSRQRRLDIVGIRIPRRCERTEVALPVRVRFDEGPGLWGKTVNLSSEGACVEFMGQPGAVGPDIEIQFCAAGAMDAPVRGKVCWVKSAGDGSSRCGVYVRAGDLLTRASLSARRVG